jgi:predicted phage terminase large subunit-like protein
MSYAIAQYPIGNFGAHHYLIARKLQEVFEGGIRRLAIHVPPQYGKSTISTQLFPSYWLGHHPSKPVMVATCTQSLASGFGLKVRNYLQTPLFGSLFPGCQLDPSSQAKDAFATTAGGVYNAIGIEGTGVGKPAYGLVIDDIIKNRKQADSQTYQELAIDLYQSVLRPRVHPGGWIAMISTKWGKSDFYAWVLEQWEEERRVAGIPYEVINISALIEDEEQEQDDPLGRKMGQHLWPERYSLLETLALKVSAGEREWWAQYQQRPKIDGDLIFDPNTFKFYSERPFCKHYVHSWDMTFGSKEEGKSSWVVGQVWGIHYVRKDATKKVLLYQTRKQLGYRATKREVQRLLRMFPADRVLIEDKANGPAVIDDLRSEIPQIRAILPKGDKKGRAYAVTPMLERGEVLFPDWQLKEADGGWVYPWVRPLRTELGNFPKGQTDDCIDTMTQALYYLMDGLPSDEVITTDEEQERDALMREWA